MSLHNIIKSISANMWIMRSIHKTIYFNLKYLPLRQAVRLPVMLYKPHFHRLRGNIHINSDKIRPGMVKLGMPQVSIYPDSGITLDIGGTITFCGACNIGNASYISIGDVGHAVLGDRFHATASLRLVCHDRVTTGSNVLIGWDTLICDTDFHHTVRLEDMAAMPSHGAISIGSNIWIANGCAIMKNSEIPDDTIVAARSLVNRRLGTPGHSLVAGTPAVLKCTGITWNDE